LIPGAASRSDNPAAFTGALWFLDLMPDELLALDAAPAAQKVGVLLRKLAAGVRFRPAPRRDLSYPLGWADTL